MTRIKRKRKYHKMAGKNSRITKKDTEYFKILFFWVVYLIFTGFFILLFIEAAKTDIVLAKIFFLFVYVLAGFGLPILIIETYVYLKTGKKLFLLKEL